MATFKKHPWQIDVTVNVNGKVETAGFTSIARAEDWAEEMEGVRSDARAQFAKDRIEAARHLPLHLKMHGELTEEEQSELAQQTAAKLPSSLRAYKPRSRTDDDE